MDYRARYTPHVYTQRQRWTGFCTTCGLPTEHRVHNYELPLGQKAEPVEYQPEPQIVEPESVLEEYNQRAPQLALF